jgi:uncharacterized membrane protein YphA (DoxX/SURF4 family)
MKEAALVARVALATVLFVAGIAKLRAPRSFRTTLAELRLPTAAASLFAVVIPAWELVTAVLLVSGWLPALGAASSAVLATVFVVSAGLARRSGHDVPCNCFGTARERLGGTTVIRASMLFGAAVVVFVAALAGDGGWWPEAFGDVVAAGFAGLGLVVIGRYAVLALSWNDRVLLPHPRSTR